MISCSYCDAVFFVTTPGIGVTMMLKPTEQISLDIMQLNSETRSLRQFPLILPVCSLAWRS